MNAKIFVTLLAVGLALSISVASASTIGTSIGVEFGIGGTAGIGAGLSPTQVAGVVPSANWNVAVGNGGSIANVVQDTLGVASATSVTVAWTSPDTWNDGQTYGFTGADGILNSGYLDGSGAGTATVTFTGLTAAHYDVYINDVATPQNKGGNMVVNGVDDLGAAGSVNGPTYVLFSPSSPGNYHLFSDVAPTAGGTISIAVGGDSFRIPINAVELVPRPVPEPASFSLLAMAGVGALGLAAIANRRRRV